MALPQRPAQAIAGALLILIGAAPVAAVAQAAPAAPAPAPGDARPQASPDAADGITPGVEGMTPAEAAAITPMAMVPPDIVVTGTRLRRQASLVASGPVLAGEALAAQVRPTIGETLAHLPGISSNAFGPSASRPVLRGFQGERGRILIDGIGTLDVSNTSPDHAVALNPLVADRIEVLRGPDALLYASGSSGGVVNSVSGRIARRQPDGFDIVASAGYGSAATEAMSGARFDAAVGGPVVLHFDGQYLRGDSLGTGGFILAPLVRAPAAAVADPAIGALARLRGVLPNTGFETWEAAGGASVILGRGHAGFSVSDYQSRYGLPTRFSLDPAAPVPDTRIDLNQLRVDGRFELDLDGALRTLRTRFGWADYRHFEIVVGGPVTATFRNRAWESRVEGVFGQGKWRATLGAAWLDRDFRVDGPAPLLPPNRTRQLALFALHELKLGAATLSGSVRYEHNDLRARVDPVLLNPASRRGFDVWALALGGNVPLARDWRVALNANYQERAPVVEELFSQGIDPGTQGQLLGNAALPRERSWTVEGVVRGDGRWGRLTLSAYYTRFSSFIYARQTGAIVAGLPSFQFSAAAADYWGLEAQASAGVADIGTAAISADALLDYTEATLGDGSPVPRIPPLRLLAGLAGKGKQLDGRIEIEWTTPQSRVSAFETPTRGFVMVNFGMSWRPWRERVPLTLRLAANNLLDAEARRAASFLKDFAPLAGRDIRLSARVSF